jgi:uncharacterized protein (TIGR03000 family)
MYSLVLMMALSGSADAPAGLFNHGCNGCSGSSCNGGCSGYSCGGGHGCHGGRSKHGCHGCNGGCSGYSCSGGGCHGCHGGRGGLFHRNNCHGCNGGCSGYSCHGGACYGGCTGAGCMGGAPAAPAAPPAKAPEKVVPPAEKGEASATPATLVVSLPADAKLMIDGNATRSISTTRTFVTPALETGKEFSYTLKAEVVRDGQTFTAIKNVTVKGGEESKVSIEIPVTSVVAK